MNWDETFDVIVLGSGIGGLAAALAAQRARLHPLLLEKADLVGGATTTSYGFVWSGDNHLMRASGAVDRLDDIVGYMKFLGGGELVEERMMALVRHGPDALKFFADCGIGFQLTHGVPDHYFGSAPGARAEGRTIEPTLISGAELGAWRDRVHIPQHTPYWVTAEEQVALGGINRFSRWDQRLVEDRKRNDVWGKGLGLIGHFLKAALARHVPIRTGAQTDRLVLEDGRVVGIAMRDGTRIAARKGVVIATGGYERNAELMLDFEGLPAHCPQSPPSLTGDGLIFAAEIGGAIRRIQNNLQMMLGYTVIPDGANAEPLDCTAGIVELCSPHTIVVNRRGLRFADESAFQSMVSPLKSFDAARHEYLNLPCYLVFDAQYAAKYSFGKAPLGAPIPRCVARSDSVTGLAAALKIDPEGLTGTVSRFNGFAAAGRDADFRRGEAHWRMAKSDAPAGQNTSLGTLTRAPFYGIELRPSLLSSSAGLLTDVHGQVVHQRRHPIPGLYATGLVAARTELGAGYQAGLNLASAMTFSYLATRHMTA